MKIVPPTDTETIGRFINNNKLVILPTDTVMGISALVSCENLIAINTAKNRNKSQPILTLIADVAQIKALGWGNESELTKLQQISQLGPATGIIRSKEDSGQAVRLVSKDSWLGQLIVQTGPIYSTSANLHGETMIANTPNTANQVFGDQISLFVLDPKFMDADKPSTIIDLRGEQPIIIREGIIETEKILIALDPESN